MAGVFGAGALRGLGGPLAGSGPLGVRERGPGKTGGVVAGGLYVIFHSHMESKSRLTWLSKPDGGSGKGGGGFS